MLLHDVVEVAGRQVSQDALLGFDANRADGLLDVRVEAREAEGVADTEQVFLFGHVAEGGLVDHHLEVDLALFILRLHVELDRAHVEQRRFALEEQRVLLLHRLIDARCCHHLESVAGLRDLFAGRAADWVGRRALDVLQDVERLHIILHLLLHRLHLRVVAPLTLDRRVSQVVLAAPAAFLLAARALLLNPLFVTN